MFYIVATSGRTGSNFLQQLMSRNGFGNPNEHFYTAFGFGEFAEAGGSTEQWLEKKRAEHAVDGVFGVKIMATHLAPMAQHASPPEKNVEAITRRIMPEARYVYLYRQDTFRQALSNMRAAATGQYVIRKGKSEQAPVGAPPPEFDADELAKHIMYIARSNQQWESIFREQDITPLVVAYEDLIGSPRETFLDVCSFLGLNPGEDPSLETDLVRQAGATTERYLELADVALGSKFERLWTPTLESTTRS